MESKAKIEMPPGYELVTDGRFFRWRFISTKYICLSDYLTKEGARSAAWEHYNYKEHENGRVWTKV
jgi:hypothetical protein